MVRAFAGIRLPDSPEPMYTDASACGARASGRNGWCWRPPRGDACRPGDAARAASERPRTTPFIRRVLAARHVKEIRR